MNRVYKDINLKIDINPGHMALLLSIFASATYSWTFLDDATLFPNIEDANQQSMAWTKAALDVLHYSRRITSGNVEDIQAMIILSDIVRHIEVGSITYRDLLSTAVTIARGLLLHRVDDHSNPALTAKLPPDSIHAEIGRRIWWDLAATDWYVFYCNSSACKADDLSGC